MTTITRSRQSLVRYLALLAAAAVAMALLPLTGTALAQDDVTDPHDACPEEPPPAPYTDRDEIPDVHLRNVDCVTHRNIAEGFADNTYRPRLPVRRDQMASFVARTIEEAGHELPDADEHEGFEDTSGNTHEDRIRQLAAAGIVEGGPEELPATQYGPERRVRRDQMASFLLRAAEYVFDQELGSDDQRFTDVPEGNVHFENVNAAAEFDLALGGPGALPDTQYGPALKTRRDQMASFLARLLQFLENPPEEIRVPPENLELDPDAETNTVGTDHTVTATVTGADDAAILPQVDVRFEVYRDVDVTDPDNIDPGDPVETDTVTTTAGTAEFTYTGPNDPAQDLIVACVDDGTDECDVTFALQDGDLVADFGGDQVGDTATKTWVPDDGEPEVAPQVLTLDPAAETNTVGTDHTVTATVTGADNEPINPQVDVRFEVYRDADVTDPDNIDLGAPVEDDTVTTTDGTAEFTYTGPNDPAQDFIVACVVDQATDECVFEPALDPESGDLIADFGEGEVGGTATKTWVPEVAPQVLTLDPAADVNDVGTDHTVTATVTGADNEPINPQVDVRFEVYRDVDVTDPDNIDLGAPVEDDTVTTTDGTAEFTYTGPDDPAQDFIVACVVDQATDECVFEPALDPESGDLIADFGEGEVGGTATKTWLIEAL